MSTLKDPARPDSAHDQHGGVCQGRARRADLLRNQLPEPSVADSSSCGRHPHTIPESTDSTQRQEPPLPTKTSTTAERQECLKARKPEQSNGDETKRDQS